MTARSYFQRSRPDPELYEAIREAERAAQHAHNLCYHGEGHGASPWLAMALGRAQSILMTQVTRFAGLSRDDRWRT